jgi:hypothetical protein
MEVEMHGIMQNMRQHYQDVQCHLSFGMSVIYSLSTVSLPSVPTASRSLNILVFVKDPPLWSINIMSGTNIWFDDILVNATAVNAPFGTNVRTGFLKFLFCCSCGTQCQVMESQDKPKKVSSQFASEIFKYPKIRNYENTKMLTAWS